jgi:hypothetical protein
MESTIQAFFCFRVPWRSRVSIRVSRWSGCSPVSSDISEARHELAVAKPFEKRVPSAARASRWGVFTIGCPMKPKWGQP